MRVLGMMMRVRLCMMLGGVLMMLMSMLLYDDAQQLHGALLRDGGDRAWTCELNSSWVLNEYLEAALPPSWYLNLRSVCVRIREQM
ncbi:MAG: hypothetical protein EBS52_11815 [Betaproteobacteria bacterium]|nr:hypothetical protein [Betaproteobacteria bacterium]